MGIYLYIQRDNFWEVCVVMKKFMCAIKHNINIAYIYVWKLPVLCCMLFNVTHFICTTHTVKVILVFFSENMIGICCMKA